MGNFLVQIYPMQYLEYIYTKEMFVIYLRFKFGWESYILSGNTTLNLRSKLGEKSCYIDRRQENHYRQRKSHVQRTWGKRALFKELNVA